jgi:hypothetical protein
LSQEYDRLFSAKQGGRDPIACHVFASMFKIGLLGYVGMHPETAELVQYFRHPGEVPLDRDDVLPEAEQFLIHPSPRPPDRQLQPRILPQSRQAQRNRR